MLCRKKKIAEGTRLEHEGRALWCGVKLSPTYSLSCRPVACSRDLSDIKGVGRLSLLVSVCPPGS